MRHLLLALLLACSHDAKPAAEEAPPLPPASGTPIGYLIDSATDLSLTDDQLTKLRTIDAKLTAELDVLDKQTQHHQQASSGDNQVAQNPMGRHHGGGHRHQRGASAGSGSNTPPVVDKDADARASGDRTADVKAAIDEAFELFDDTQREKAHKVLSEHGVDI